MHKIYSFTNTLLLSSTEVASWDSNTSLSLNQMLCSAPGGPVDVRGAEAHQRHTADHRVRQDGARLHEVPPGGPDRSS